MQNPLQQYFRQPKIFVKLPSGGIFSKMGTFQGDVSNMPVYGMTGMDEIIMKTPDALLSGESVAQVVASCCPVVKDPWEIPTIDMPTILAGIRIATYGEQLEVEHKCPSCQAENSYDLNLTAIIGSYTNKVFDNKVRVDSIVINIKPLSYRDSAQFSLSNFKLQQRLAQIEKLESDDEKQKAINDIFKDLSLLQQEIYKATVESIETPSGVVTEKKFIEEFLQNCDAAISDAIKDHNEKNNLEWSPPTFPVKCDSCGFETSIAVELDQSNFFVKA